MANQILNSRNHTNKVNLKRLTILIATLFSLTLVPLDADAGLCEKHLSVAAKKYAVPFAILYAVGLAESGRRGKLHPYALNVEGKTYFASSKKAAMLVFNREWSIGKKLIDIGCMQINHKYHSHEFISLGSMFDPFLNVDYAARFLRRLKNRHGTWSTAVARYHAGDRNHQAQKIYVCRVLSFMISMKLAQSTISTKKHCNSKR